MIQLTPDHAHIEAEEDARERAFQGLANDADLAKDHVAVDPLEDHAHAPGEGPPDAIPIAQESLKAGDEAPPVIQRVMAGAAPNRLGEQADSKRKELDDAKNRARGGEGYDGHKPRSAEERLRAGVPYSEF